MARRSAFDGGLPRLRRRRVVPCIEHQGVTIDGPLGLASRGATQASEMYARNLMNFVALFVRDGQLGFDWEDELLAKTRWQA